MEAVLASKTLDFNLSKSVFIVIGDKRFKENMQKKLEETPLLLCNQNMKQVDNYPYLGQVVSEKGVSDSSLKTINKRYGIAYKAIFEIKAIMEDSRSKVPGGFLTATTIWNMAVLPALLNSAECWLEIPKAGMEKLDRLQETFYQVLLNTPRTTPKPGLYWFTGGMLMTNIIMVKKVLFLYHLIHLQKDSLASEILQVQRQIELPSLWTECLQYLLDLDISLEELNDLTKQQFKRRVQCAAKEKNRKDLLTLIEPYRKLSFAELSEEDFETKPYFHELNLQQARLRFAIDTKMLRTIKSYYPSDKKNEDDFWECQHCSRIDSVRHLLRCPFFEELRVNKNLHSNQEDLVEYFRQIINVRMENEQAQHL